MPLHACDGRTPLRDLVQRKRHELPLSMSALTDKAGITRNPSVHTLSRCCVVRSQTRSDDSVAFIPHAPTHDTRPRALYTLECTPQNATLTRDRPCAIARP